MKKLSFLNRIILLALVSISTFFSCTKEFIPDPINPELPIYSEEGNSLSGAYVNGNIWRSNTEGTKINSYGVTYSYASQIKVWKSKDSLILNFDGRILNRESSDIGFSLKNLEINTLDDLLKLNDRKIALNGNDRYGYYQETYKRNTLRGKGQIYFKSVKKNSNGITLSGGFGFQTIDSIGNITNITYGRFDYNFYKDSNFYISD